MLPGGAAPIVAAAIARKRKQIIAAFRAAGAVSPKAVILLRA